MLFETFTNVSKTKNFWESLKIVINRKSRDKNEYFILKYFLVFGVLVIAYRAISREILDFRFPVWIDSRWPKGFIYISKKITSLAKPSLVLNNILILLLYCIGIPSNVNKHFVNISNVNHINSCARALWICNNKNGHKFWFFGAEPSAWKSNSHLTKKNSFFLMRTLQRQIL